MPKNNRPEFHWDDNRKAYKKVLKHPITGRWSVTVWGKTKPVLREKIAEKEAELAALKAEYDAGNADGKLYVYQYAQTWYRLNTGGVAERTRKGYQNVINNHICPVIGGMELSAVTLDDAKKVISAAVEKGLAIETQKKIISTMQNIFEAAVDADKIRKNPCKNLEAQGRKPPKKKALTREQQQTVVAALKGEQIYIFVMLCLFCGLRREEALGLQWRDVHLDETEKTPWLEVCRTCTWPHNKPHVTEYTKSAAGHRRLPIPDTLAEALRAEPRTSEHVCHTTNGAAYSETSFRNAWAAVTDRFEHTVQYKQRVKGEDGGRAWKTVTETLKVGDVVPHKDRVVAFNFTFTPHTLRHTYITELIYANVPLKTVQYLAGHATPDITIAIYTDIMLNRPEDTIAQVNEGFKHFQAQSSSTNDEKNAEMP